MIDEFWGYYQQYYFEYIYHEFERARLKSILRWTSVASYFVTAVSLATWGVTQRFAILWSPVIFFSQVVNNLKDQLSVNKRIWALDEYIGKSAVEIEKFAEGWRLIKLGRLTDTEILKRLNQSSAIFVDLDITYIRPFGAREYKRLIDKANVRTNEALTMKHGKGEDYVK